VAQSDDPGSAVVLANMSWSSFIDHQLDSAVVMSRRALQNDSANLPAIGLGARVLLANHQPKEARELTERAPGFPTTLYVIARAGDPTTARRRLSELGAATPPLSDLWTKRAYAYLGLGDTESALYALEQATEHREIWHAGNGVPDPAFDPVRKSPRFRVLLRRLRLAP
jgi:Flp pilus assembly protein TadD